MNPQPPPEARLSAIPDATGRGAGQPVRQAGTVQACVLVACNLMPIMAVVALAPVLPLLLKHFESTPNSTFLVPVALTVPALSIALFSGVSGVLADRFGRHRTMIIALLVYAFFGVMPLWLDDLHLIIASRIGIGLAESMIITLVTTLTGDYVSGDQRRKWIGFSAAFGSVLASGLFAAGGALGQISWRGPFALYFLGIPIAGLVAWLLWEPAGESPAQRRAAAVTAAAAGPANAMRVPFPLRKMLLLYAFTVPMAMLFFVGPIHLGRVMNEIGITEPARIGMATGIAHLGVPVGAVVFRYISSWSLWRVAGLAIACVGLPLIGLRAASDFSQVMALMLVSQFGCGLMLPTMLGWCLSNLPFQWRGRGSGLFTSTLFVGQFITPLSFAFLFKTTGSVMSAMLGFGLLGAATLAAVLLSRVQWGTADKPGAPPTKATPAATPPRVSV